MMAGLDSLSSADRGFVTWLAGMVHEPVDAVWARITAPTAATRIAGRHVEALDLTPIGPQLRWAVGPQRSLTLPLGGLDALVELDCSGMELDGLDVRSLVRLRTLRCADNRLRELDLAALGSLEALDCSGNALMVLDLRANRSLREVECAGNGLGVLVLPPGGDGDTLVRLDCSRNQLMVLALGDRPALVEVRCFRNALVHLQVGRAPALTVLDASRNDLARIEVAALPALTTLHLGRNRLDAFDPRPFPAVRDLRLHGNYIGALDLSALPSLEVVDARSNQLEAVAVADRASLAELELSDNRIDRLDLGRAPALEVLRVRNNALTALDVGGCPRLLALDCGANPLPALDVGRCPSLLDLRCDGTALARLDVTANADLARLTTRDARGRGPAVEATLDQRRRLRELRDANGLGTGSAQIEEMDAFELHDLASAIGGRDPEEHLLRIVTAPRCDLGTALMVYWTGSPRWYLRYPSREEVPPYELAGWDLLRAIERRVESGGFATAVVPFDPANDRHTRSVRGVDWTRDERAEADEPRGASARDVPPELRRRCP
ncbi:MAG: DUF4274 domain-containing protein [Myxococcota bacterium]